jgi:hypothetical protein
LAKKGIDRLNDIAAVDLIADLLALVAEHRVRPVLRRRLNR